MTTVAVMQTKIALPLLCIYALKFSYKKDIAIKTLKMTIILGITHVASLSETTEKRQLKLDIEHLKTNSQQ